MPGVFGWIDLGHPRAGDARDAAALLDEMASRLRHGGREQVDTWTDPRLGFAIGRVALREPPAPPWPSAGSGEDGTAKPSTRVFVEGTLRGGATEVERLRDPAGRGRGALLALPALRGSFTLACFEPSARRLTLAVDRRASRPLAWTRAGSRLYFAPEVKALLAAPGFDKEIDEAALGLFLGAGYTLGHQTLFVAARRLSGGEALVAGPEGVRIEPYWRYRLDARGDGSSARDLEEEVARLVRASVERDLGDPERAIVFLSGGVDSRAIAAIAQDAARRQGTRARTVTWSAPSPKRGSDRDVAREVAAALGTRHRAVVRQVSGWGRRLVEVAYLLDGLTDVPAYHPQEHEVMRDLAAAGACAVLRGDECFGWEGRVTTLDEAWLSLNLRSPRLLRLAASALRPPAGARLAAAAEAALAEAARFLDGAHPDDAKDLFYFRHRLQGYLGPAAYLKQVVLDHRAPLLDEALLDLNARVPAHLRAHKLLFCRAASRLAPALSALPLAHHGSLEDWGLLLASRSPVRRHAEAELADAASGIWEIFDRGALAAALPEIGAPPASAPSARLLRTVKTIARAALHVSPGVERRALFRAHRAALRLDQLCLRVLVLKAWHDLFVQGDGSRRALAERLGRIEG